MLDKPKHYTKGKIECIEYIRDQLTTNEFRAHCKATAIKYLHRYKLKGTPEQDIQKAIDYLEWLKETYENERCTDNNKYE